MLKKTLLLAVVLATVGAVACSARSAPSASSSLVDGQIKGDLMSPTLKNGDKIQYDKSAFKNTGPNRGDIVIFHYQGGDRILRVIGLPGETVPTLHSPLTLS